MDFIEEIAIDVCPFTIYRLKPRRHVANGRGMSRPPREKCQGT